MKETCDEVLGALGINDPQLAGLQWNLSALRFLMTHTSFERKLYPNVDFYSGIILKAIGIPVDMFYGYFCIRPYCRLDQPLVRNARFSI